MKPSTSSRPCSQYQPKACKEIKVQQKIAKDFQCQAPIFYSGQHLDNKQISILPICNDSVILKMIALFEEGGLACSENLPCEHTDYIIDSQLSEYDDDSTDSSIRLTCRWDDDTGRGQTKKISRWIYVSIAQRLSLDQLTISFFDLQAKNDRRVSVICEYQSTNIDWTSWGHSWNHAWLVRDDLCWRGGDGAIIHYWFIIMPSENAVCFCLL